jgi:hypothetical protein
MLGKQHRKRLLNKSFGTADILAHDCTATGRPPRSRRISPRNSRFVPDSLEGARFELLPPIEKRFLLGEWELSCAGDKRRFRNKTASNSWSHRDRNGCERVPGGAIWASDLTLTGFGFRAGVLDGGPATEPFAGAGPAVRIRFAPAVSLVRTRSGPVAKGRVPARNIATSTGRPPIQNAG